MSIFTSAQAFQQTRHARRLYVGGVPPNYTDEEELKHFLNSVIAKGLGEANDNSFVLSIYINQKKCFAFIELRSIELATAALALDGIIFKKVVLKILRANEYKPELIPASLTGSPLVLDLSSFAFGNCGSPPQSMRTVPVIPDQRGIESKMDTIVRTSSLSAVEAGSLVVIGFPFDGSHQRDSLPKPTAPSASNKSTASTPRALRSQWKRSRFGSLQNMEYDVDLTALRVADLGDIVSGKTAEDTLNHLSAVVHEVVRMGGLPFIVGGSDVLPAVAGALGRATNGLGALAISANMKDIDGQLGEPGVVHVRFAAQGSLCSSSAVTALQESGGKVIWLSSMRAQGAAQAFHDALSFAGNGWPVLVSLDMSAASSAVGGAAQAHAGPQGLTADDLLDIAMAAGTDSRVIAFIICQYHPEGEDSRASLVLSELFYRFAMGRASRTHSIPVVLTAKRPTSGVQVGDLVSHSSGTDSNRSSANFSQPSERNSRVLLHSSSPRPPSLPHDFGGLTTTESSARTSVRLSDDMPISRPNSGYTSLARHADNLLPIAPIQYEDEQVDGYDKRHGRKLDPLRMDAFGSDYVPYQSPMLPMQPIGDDMDSKAPGSFYSFNNYEHRRSGFRLSSTPMPQHAPPARMAPRPYSSASGPHDHEEGFYSASAPASSYSTAPTGFAAMDASNTDGELLKGLRGLLSDPKQSLWKR